MLERYGVDPQLARFARTHGNWNAETVAIEDLLVALSDEVWKGKRNPELEQRVVEVVVADTSIEPWTVFEKLDKILTDLAGSAEWRLAWQAGACDPVNGIAPEKLK